MKIELDILALATNTRTDLSDDYWGSVVTEITLLPHVPTEALDGIDTFSHLEIIYYFNLVDPSKIVYSGHPRGNTDWPKVGIFAQRKKERPNQIGLTTVTLLEHNGRTIKVTNFDGVNGTPILDIKPVMQEFLANEKVTQPAWSVELMSNYWAK